MKELQTNTFPEFITAGRKVVEFSADWCIDCKRILPDLPEIENTFSSTFDFAMIDVDESQEVAQQFQVKGIPTFIVFENGKEVGRLPSRNAKTKEQVVTFLRELE
ncbi:thioredoxin family protein [Baia soyae]|uniref:Thioredoxin n=1 Tax=Baia soyae TaxID=1544746 RepID=A0A4R2RY74_9BACL|nr:thioredoxin family protein [Baia soyae]TCP69598.1 thioredoxin [Baia soyae]